jgi:hypothetical protein
MPLHSPTSQGVDEFSHHIQSIHEGVRRRLVLSAEKYKKHADLHRRPVSFEIGDFVLVRLRPERFPRGTFYKLHHRRAGPFKILKWLGANAYHLALPDDLSISPIFNVKDLTAYPGSPDATTPAAVATLPSAILPPHAQPRDQIDAILHDQLVSTRQGGYQKFLVRWKNCPLLDASWLKTEEV